MAVVGYLEYGCGGGTTLAALPRWGAALRCSAASVLPLAGDTVRSMTDDEPDSSLLLKESTRCSLAGTLAMMLPGRKVEGLGGRPPSPWSEELDIDCGEELRKAAASASVWSAEPTVRCWLPGELWVSSPEPEVVPNGEESPWGMYGGRWWSEGQCSGE